MGAVMAAIADGLVTFMWVFCSSTFGLLTSLIAGYIGLAQTQWMAILFITTVIMFIFLFTFGIICDFLGGAIFNPAVTAAVQAAGLGGSNSIFSAALRFPAQAAGAVGGVLAITEVMPTQYKKTLGGPFLKVDLHTGAIAEGLLTFITVFLVLVIELKGPSSSLTKNWLISISTIVLIAAGAGYTGPSMNPANAFGWAYINNRHNTWEQFYVYWICPLVGAILAAWIFRAIFPLPAPKQKKA